MYELGSGRIFFTPKGRKILTPALGGVGISLYQLRTLGEFKKAWFEVQLRTIKINQKNALSTQAKSGQDISEVLVP